MAGVVVALTRCSASSDCRLDAVDTPLERVIHCSTQTEPRRHAVLPVLESTCTPDPLEAVSRDEIGAVMIGLRRHEPIEDRRTDVQKAGAARTSQVLAPSGRQQVAADLVDVDTPLTDRLTCIEQERHAGSAGERPDVSGRIDEPTVGRDVGERDESDIVTFEPIGHCVDIDLPRPIARHTIDDHPAAFSSGEERNDVGAVLVVVHDDMLPRRHRHRPERSVPGCGGVFHPGEIHRTGADQPGDRPVHLVAPIAGECGGFVAAQFGFGLQVADVGVEHHLWREGRPSMVQVNHAATRTARRHRTSCGDLVSGEDIGHRSDGTDQSSASRSAFSITSVSAGWM